jgi:broad specificity phosphatase PhoE
MSSTTQVVLIRHGQSQGNAEGRFGGHTLTPLSELGRKQAAATGRVLAAENFKAIYTSDLPRAIETASPLSLSTAIKLQPTEAFRERSVGVMAGLTFEEAAEKYPEQYQALLRRDFDHVLLGGESYHQTLDRAAEKLDEAIEEYKGGQIAIFTHAGTICILVLHLMGALAAPELKPVWIASSNCGISRFDLHHDGFVRVIVINDTRHLEDL